MFAILRSYDIPKEIVDAIRVLYDNSKSAVFVDRQLSDEFDVTVFFKGIFFLPSYLSLFWTLDDKERNIKQPSRMTYPRRSIKHPKSVLNAVDIDLLESNIQRLNFQTPPTLQLQFQLGY